MEGDTEEQPWKVTPFCLLLLSVLSVQSTGSLFINIFAEIMEPKKNVMLLLLVSGWLRRGFS